MTSMCDRKKMVLSGVLVLVIISSIIGVNAGILSSIKNLFQTGEERGDLEGGLLEAHHANLSIQNDPPMVCNIFPYVGTLVGPIIEYDGVFGSPVTNITAFNLSIFDPNGVGDLPDTEPIVAAGYVVHSPNAAGYTDAFHTRRNFTGVNCKYVGLKPNGGNDCGRSGDSVIYTCNVSMYYYDDPQPSTWDVNVTDFRDIKSNNIESSYFKSGIFSLMELDGFYTNESLIEFGNVPAVLRLAISAVNPIILINTANGDFDGSTDSRTIYFNGSNLTLQSGSAAIPSDNFNVHLSPVAVLGRCNSTDGGPNITLENGKRKNFSSTTPLILNNGDHAILGDAKRNVYFCLKSLPTSLPEGTYSTQYGSGQRWLITN
jgi:hypothetical protein